MIEWRFAKFFFALFVLPFLVYVLFDFEKSILANGICQYLDCSYLAHKTVKFVIVGALLVSFLFYLLEVKMTFVLFLLSFLSALICSAGNSSGIHYQADILTMILIAQFLAYFKFFIYRNKKRLFKERFTFSIQIISASYCLSALSKLMSSGWQWVLSNEELVFQINANLSMYELNWGISLEGYIMFLNNTLLKSPVIVTVLLSLALLVELFAVAMLLGKQAAKTYGYVLLTFHLGILFLMAIFIPTIVIPMAIFTVNVPYLIYKKFR